MKLAVFDCDGTLVDSQANICRAMEAAFVRAGLPPPRRAATRAIVGLSLAEAVRVLLPDADEARARDLAAGYKDAFRGFRAAGELDHEPLFEGIAETLAALAAGGWTLGIATGKSDRGLGHVLVAHGLDGAFATLQTADRHPSKPDPAMLLAAMAEVGAHPDDTVMIGDTSFDMIMAKAADARAVGAAWGYHSVAELLDGGADVVATVASEVPGLLA